VRRRRELVVGAALAAALATGVLLAVHPAGRSAVPPQVAGCRKAAADHAAGLRAPVTPGAPGLVVVLGDSYSQGAGLRGGPSAAFPALVARATGRTVHLDGFGSTGFTTRGFCVDRPVTYGERLTADQLLALRPSAVVVEGGVNDARHGRPAAVGAAAADLLRRLAAVPQVVVVGPADVRADRRQLAAVDDALAADAAAAGRPYLDLRRVRLPLQPDGVHPTREGQRAIAALLVPLLEQPGAAASSA
jgi:lysophospholipase L1-like esterase